MDILLSSSSFSSSEILLSHSNIDNLSPNPSIQTPIPINSEQENCDPELTYDSELKKIPSNLRQNRIRSLNPRVSSKKTSKLCKVQNDFRNILKQTSEKQLLHSKSFQLIEIPSKNIQYPTLLKRKNTFEVQKPEFIDLNDVDFRQILAVSIEDLSFGDVFPGNILEKELEIKNKTFNDLVIRILIGCKNEELKMLDEYVYSITKVEKCDYNEKLLFVLPAGSSLKTMLALKVPNLKEKCEIQGFYSIEIVGLNKSLMFHLDAQAKIPKISCLKEIYDKENRVFVMKFALKKGKKQDFKVFIKNDSEFNVEGNFEFLEKQKENEAELMMYPLNACITGFGTFALSLMVKPKSPICQKKENFTTISKVLLFKIKNSSLIYFFALAIELY